MMNLHKTARNLAYSVLTGVGVGIGYSAATLVIAQAPAVPVAPAVVSAPATFKNEEPAYRGLDANLFMQTSAEYRACCLQAYNLATLRLREGVAAAKGKPGKLAVVLDLDETVFDNAGFQAMEIRSNLSFDLRLWTLWEENSEMVGLIPGAKEFILEADKLGVNVVYISNRRNAKKSREQTRNALTRFGIPSANDAQLKLSDGPSDKTSRREDVEKEFQVLLYVGDNLRDFDEKFKCPSLGKKTPEELDAAIRSRKETVDKDAAGFGSKWIILPNPAYGEWAKPLGFGKSDMDRLVPVVETKK